MGGGDEGSGRGGGMEVAGEMGRVKCSIQRSRKSVIYKRSQEL